MPIKQRVLKTVVGCLAAVGTWDVFGRGLLIIFAYLRSFGPPSDVIVHGPLVSPDRKFKVVEFGSFGGGGLSPYCHFIFSIVPTAVPDKLAWKDANRVASLPCLGLSAGGIGHGINWVEDHHLRMVVDVTKALQNGRLVLKPHDATGQVFIDYESR